MNFGGNKLNLGATPLKGASPKREEKKRLELRRKSSCEDHGNKKTKL